MRSPSTKAPFLHRHYPASQVLRASPPPQSAQPDSHESPVDPAPITAGVSRVASGPRCLHAVATTPAGPMKPVRSHRVPSASAFPVCAAGRLLRCPFRGLLSVHSRYGLHAHRVAMRPSAPKASATSLPPPPLRLLPGGTNQFPGGTFTRVDQFPMAADLAKECTIQQSVTLKLTFFSTCQWHYFRFRVSARRVHSSLGPDFASAASAEAPFHFVSRSAVLMTS